MYPTKSTLDFMSEMNRLFPRTGENDMLLSPAAPSSVRSFNQSSLGRSSSSTDTSPDSFPSDLTSHEIPEMFQQYEVRENFNLRSDHNVRQQDFIQRQNQLFRQGEFNVRPGFERQHLYEDQRLDHHFQQYETPFAPRRQRPIVGRKIMTPMSQIQKIDEVSNVDWLEETLLSASLNMEQKHNQNVFYELFPTENKGVEFKTPVKTSPNPHIMSSWINESPRMPVSPSMTNISPIMTHISPSMSNMSPRMTNVSRRMPELTPRMLEMPSMMQEMSPNRNLSPGSSGSSYSQRFSTPFKEPIVGPSNSMCLSPGQTKMCTFCRKNGETPIVYMTHRVKEKIGNRNVVTCPILRSHVCSTCGASGDVAHTITYCPILRSSNNGQPLKSTTITLKNTRIKSNGRRRY